MISLSGKLLRAAAATTDRAFFLAEATAAVDEELRRQTPRGPGSSRFGVRLLETANVEATKRRR